MARDLHVHLTHRQGQVVGFEMADLDPHPRCRRTLVWKMMMVMMNEQLLVTSDPLV